MLHLTLRHYRETLRTSNAMALKQCALAGMGITLEARWMVGRELRARTLIDNCSLTERTCQNRSRKLI
jgi:DNA-binding transcriptional LysR family regulator